MSHAPHEALPGYSDDHLLHDGCSECEQRGKNPDMAIGHMDEQTFAAAWERAVLYERGHLHSVSAAEVPLLRVLWAIQCQLERRGIPIGEIPGHD